MYAAPVSYTPIYNNMGFQNPLWPRSSVTNDVNCWSLNWWSPELTYGLNKSSKFGRRRSRRHSKRRNKRKSKNKKRKRRSRSRKK